MKTNFRIFLLIGILALLSAIPLLGSFYTQLFTRVLIWAIFAISLDLLVGYTGLISLGHAAFFGTGAYVLGMVFKNSPEINLLVALPLSLIGSALLALLIGAACLRTRGVYFIMLSLAFAQMLYFFAFQTNYLGGDDGIFLLGRPTMRIGTIELIDLSRSENIYIFVLTCLVLLLIFMNKLIASPFGKVLYGIKHNETRMRSLGYPVYRFKLISFIIAGTLGGLSGFLEASHSGYINPSFFYWHESGLVLVMVVLGGMGTFYGPVLGASLVILLENFLPDLFESSQLALGTIIVLIVLFMPRGLFGILQRKNI
ncbi:MAG: branched-chain amino acid ABC transporter permease [Deltaproteobacteria bacterium]|nr:branched-chain amino acid ABC transporter permease [Deltaproteobacteria bacterium]